MEMIRFRRNNYPIRNLFLDKINQEVLISTADLNEVLLKNGEYVSDIAEVLDNQIFYFVEKNEIELPKIELILKLESII